MVMQVFMVSWCSLFKKQFFARTRVQLTDILVLISTGTLSRRCCFFWQRLEVYLASSFITLSLLYGSWLLSAGWRT